MVATAVDPTLTSTSAVVATEMASILVAPTGALMSEVAPSLTTASGAVAETMVTMLAEMLGGCGSGASANSVKHGVRIKHTPQGI